MYEEVKRGGLAELAAWAEGGVRGECVIVVGGAPNARPPLAEAVAQVLELVAAGGRMKDACTEVAAATGHASRELYQAALAAKSDAQPKSDAKSEPDAKPGFDAQPK